MSLRPCTAPFMSHARLYLDHADTIEEVLRFVVRRHRCSPEEAEDFFGWARLKLVENDYAILASFEGRSRLNSYLSVVFQRLFLDYRRAQWGRWRPSGEARRLGPLAVRLETMVDRDGLNLEAACQQLAAAHPDLSVRHLKELAQRLPERPPRLSVQTDGLDALPAAEPGPDAQLIENEAQVGRRRAITALPALLRELSPRDQIILRLRFGEGMQVAQIARRLGADAKPLYRHIERLTAELRSRMEDLGFDAESLGWPAAQRTLRSGRSGVRRTSSRELRVAGRLTGEKRDS